MNVAPTARRHGAVVFAKACELGLEGIVSKQAGRSRNWLKIKNLNFVRT